MQETALNVPPVEQVAVPLPEYPALQVTTTACPVVPVIEPVPALLELATCVLVQVFAIKPKQESVNNSHFIQTKARNTGTENQSETTRLFNYCLSTSARNSIERSASRASSSAASRISSVASHHNRLSGGSSDRTGAGFVGVGHLRACASVRYIQHTKRQCQYKQSFDDTKARNTGKEKQNESTRFIDYCLSTSARNSIERPASRASSSAASRISSVASHRNRLSGCSKDRIGSGIVRVGYLRACASVRYIDAKKMCKKPTRPRKVKNQRKKRNLRK